jgi:NitT/TauT family transport system substrate-binding protein
MRAGFSGRWLSGVTGIVVAVLAAFTPLSVRAEPVKIRIGWSTMPGHMIPVLYSKPEILKYYGKSYTVEPILFRGSSPQITAMAAGEIDMAAFSALALNLAVLNARQDVKVLADIIQDGVGDQHSETFLVRKESGIKTIADMKGKRIGSNAIGSASDTAIRAMFKKNGMNDKRDYTVLEVAFPNIPVMLDEGKIDMGTVLQPMSDQLIATGKYEVLFRAKDAVGPSQLVFLAGRGEFLAKNRPQVMDFFEDHVRAMRWFTDPANRTEALQIIGTFMKQSPDKLGHMFTKTDYYRDPFLFPNIRTLQDSLAVIKDVELAPNIIQLEPKYVDLSFVEEAKRRIEGKK